MAVYNIQGSINESGMDSIVNNARVRATNAPITVGTITFPAAPQGVNYIDGIGTPISTAPGAASTLLAEQLLTGIITQSPSTGNTSTFDTAANMVAAVNKISAGAVVGDVITCLLINGNSTNAITLAAGSGGSFDTNQATRNIAVNTSRYVWVRLTNVTSGSEAYIIYF